MVALRNRWLVSNERSCYAVLLPRVQPAIRQLQWRVHGRSVAVNCDVGGVAGGDAGLLAHFCTAQAGRTKTDLY